MASGAEARMDARVRKYTDDISRSLEKICNIIDEHAELHEYNWDGPPAPDFLSLIPMRYRAGGFVLELTAMKSWDHQAMTKFELPEVSKALSDALQRARDIPWAMSDAIYGRELSNKESDYGIDDETLNSIKNNLVSCFKIPDVDKAASDCISIILRKELQKIVNAKISRAKENIGIYDLPADGRWTRSRSRRYGATRSDSSDTISITPISSRAERDNAGDWCDGCFDGCNQCLPDENESATRKGIPCDGGTWGYNDPDCQCRKLKKFEKSRKVYADSRSSSKLQRNSRKSTRVAGKHARRQREWSAASSEFGPSIISRMSTMSLDDGSDLDNTTEVPGPNIYTATTASSASSHYTEPEPSLHIEHLVFEEMWDPIGHCRRREVHAIWSNDARQVMWMDEFFKKYSQEIIEYYEKSLKLKPQHSSHQYQLRPEGAPSNGSAQLPKSPIHAQWPSQYSSNTALNSGFHQSLTGHGSGPTNPNAPSHPDPRHFGMNGNNMGNDIPGAHEHLKLNAPIHPNARYFGMNGNMMGNSNSGANRHITSSTTLNYPQMGAQPGGAHGSNQYNSAPAASHRNFLGAW